ncbi:5-(carboxyamino)imidazole ribonucleotide synthase [Kibdelosporangium phytohabitans]|uniref:N5-carboxyaminoimidazole ribonucleotide synthase n=1 Tax=Kibdelosporangium phytohabitans TaxID=860235 RepID=A0A0N9IB17_9PSEU|nr:5-(carboxyamino)imidazole ribonucleotide synthase [Kibdelosporangium phytohabitans]ALG13626.1 phosphoribosylaminoimidazole carboxylase [Kibdelosporangium phytohabitans]MBE1465507.1 5-(carboxyamino)imidazole ribonucleotide synthase [Kibdelosporangium phytohabitans]
MDPVTGFPVVGMVGGGQLSRMTQQAAIALGQSLRVLAVSPTDSAALVAPNVTIGHHTDLEALRGFASAVDVLTFDHEHVPTEHLRTLVAEGFAVHPGPEALIHAQDKLVMRDRLAGMDVPIPAYAEVKTVSDVTQFGERHGWPVVLKAARGGYDGRGVWMVPSSGGELVAELLEAGTPLLVEERVDMKRELAAVVARSPFGQGAAWPTVQTVQSNGICVEVLAPAPDLPEERADEAQELALRIASTLGVVGVLAVELFETASGLVVNELAMRPHNSGHWTIEGAATSQFEQHLRAVLDYPLGSTDPVAPVIVMANVLGARSTPDMGTDERLHHLFARYKDVHVHHYGKAERPGRKIGHVTVLGTNLAEVRQRARFAADWLSTATWPDGYDVHGGK